MSRTAAAALVVMAAGGLAGPAAGQSSAWYNRDQNGAPLALTTKTLGGGEHVSLYVACTIPDMRIIAGIQGVLETEPGENVQPHAFRFDGDPDTEIVLMVERWSDGKNVAMAVRGFDALRLASSFRSGDHDRAETASPGGRWGSWTLRGARAAIDRLPCPGGGE